MPSYSVGKIAAKLVLDNGTDSEGKQKTVSINLGDMSESNFNPTQSASQTAVLAITSALEAVLSKSVLHVEAVTTGVISNS